MTWIKRRKAMRAVVGIVACLVAAGAYAKDRGRNAEALRAMDAFGRCVGGHRTDGMKLLATVPGSDEEQELAARISTTECLTGVSLRFQTGLLRGAVAEALLRRGPAVFRSTKVVPAFTVPAPEVLAQASEKQRVAIALVRFGECVARQDNAGVMALLETPVETQAERAAFVPLGDAMTLCSAMTFKVDRFQMRGFLAEGAYRVALKAAAPA